MPNARRHDPETSHEAASTTWCPSEVQANVLHLIRTHGPISDDFLYQRYYHAALVSGAVIPTPQSVRTRRAELVQAGLVQHSGLYALTETGRRAREWEAIS